MDLRASRLIDQVGVHPEAMQGVPHAQRARTAGTPEGESQRMERPRPKAVVDELRLEKALIYLASTDHALAELKAQVERKEYLCKMVRARMFHLSTQGSNESRRAEAEMSKEVQSAENEKCEAIVEYEKLKARRQTEALIVDVFRTIEASRRAGQI